MKKITIIILCLFITGQVSAGEETRELSSFSGMDIGGAFKVTLKKTGKHRVVVEADDDVLENIITEVRGNVLHVRMDGNNIRNTGPMVLTIEFSDINSLDVSGASTIVCDDLIKSTDFDLDVSGAGSTKLNLQTDRLTAEMSGAGSLNLRGSAKSQSVDMTGAGSYMAEDFECDFTEIEASGAGTARVVANKELRADCNGAGSVRYKGNPEKVYADSNGAGSVKKLN